ncbi:hypothetical protein CWR45_17750 [Oceanobacillus chungangensis]|uniref:Uncharacterized protein n=1 Tax=Oceanobacillus chungangensis TaxID=1229152 RepID=A0A3D8PK49_9BACI|nr:hypothetical protein CWR45_17750 [Oceanobacillus chungangensis]
MLSSICFALSSFHLTLNSLTQIICLLNQLQSYVSAAFFCYSTIESPWIIFSRDNSSVLILYLSLMKFTFLIPFFTGTLIAFLSLRLFMTLFQYKK